MPFKMHVHEPPQCDKSHNKDCPSPPGDWTCVKLERGEKKGKYLCRHITSSISLEEYYLAIETLTEAVKRGPDSVQGTDTRCQNA